MRRARVKMMPKNVNRVRGRDGVNRYYYRPRNGRPDIRLPDITDPGFAAAHAAAETICTSTPLVIGESRSNFRQRRCGDRRIFVVVGLRHQSAQRQAQIGHHHRQRALDT